MMRKGKNSCLNRRSAIAASVASFLILIKGKWVTPVVESVILPAHATTSESVLSRLAGKWRLTYTNVPFNEQSREFEILVDGTLIFNNPRGSETTSEIYLFDERENYIGWTDGFALFFLRYADSYVTANGSSKVGLSGSDLFTASKISE